MKLNYPQLETHLVKHLAPLYLIAGDEIILKQDAIQLIRKTAKKAGFSERTPFAASAGEEQLYSLLHAGSLLAEKRLLEMDFREHAPAKSLAKILQEYANHPSLDTLVVMDCPKLDAKLLKAAWVKSFEASGVIVTVWPIAREQLPQWILARARKYKLQMEANAARLLADYVEGNLIAAAQAIEKLYLLKIQQPVDVAMIQNILSDESHFTIFDFTDSLMAGDKSRSLHILEHLREEGIEPVLILWAITRELRSLAVYAEKMQRGERLDDILQKERVFAKRQSGIRQFLRKYNVADCLRYLSHAADIDQIIKGAKPGNHWESMQLFCLRML